MVVKVGKPPCYNSERISFAGLHEMSSNVFLFNELLDMCLLRTLPLVLPWLRLVLLSTILYKGDDLKKKHIF